MLENYEDFTEQQIKILERYVSNTSSNIFCLRNLPEVIKGALFSRYSRSSLGLRSLLLKDFVLNEETAFSSIVGEQTEHGHEQQFVAIKKAQNFYDRILDGYGDDSIGELGGAHLAVENVSMIAAKIIEDARIGGSPLEKSTRYIYFDQKVNGEYLFYREPVIMTSAFRDDYVEMCNQLFETYSKLIPPLTEYMEKKFPREHDVSNVAYTAALRAKVLDCLRGLLPTSTLTNLGMYGNGRFFETLIQKLNTHNLVELQDIGKKSYAELSKVIPSFVRRAEIGHKYQKTYDEFHEQMTTELTNITSESAKNLEPMQGPAVRLVNYDPQSPLKIAAALLFPYAKCGLEELNRSMNKASNEEIERILEATCTCRQNRRHKSPRALEHAFFTFEIVADFGIYRDLQRHRMLTQERQVLSCDLGYYVPDEIVDTEMEQDYRSAMDKAKEVYEQIAVELPEEAQYIVPMGYNIHWYFHVNLRALQWLCELRSSPAGHPMYRVVAQEMAKQVSKAVPQLERFFKFVDYEGYELGRMGQEIRTVEKKEKLRT
ncbi:MAG: FAD-dependent thymidylate synthase [Chlamydiia bacterium]|nr:FAD-dependent thymidylate synthase [Chlamydiia bacterium]MCP5509417.1 FAD-dependent thymidylate synthase [Chlamydiales bacterium]